MKLLHLLPFTFFCLSLGLKSEEHANARQIEEAFVSFATTDYFPLLEVTVESIHAFSTRPIIVYGINADVPFDTNKYPRLIKRRIDKPQNVNIYFQKFNCIIQSNVKYGIYVESDDIVNYRIDDLFTHCRQVTEYPLSPIHPQDPNNQFRLMGILDVKEKTNPYVHGHIIFSERCIPFLKKCYELAISLGNIGANWDETLLNVMLWKYRVHDYYLPVYDPYFETLSNYLQGTQPTTYSMPVTYHMIHGCKNIHKAQHILEILKENIGMAIQSPGR